MTQNFIETFAQKKSSSKWMPFLSVLISLFGIIFLNWNFQYLIILFVCEIFLMLLFAIIKMLFAQNKLPFYKTLPEKAVYLLFGIFIGAFFMVFSVLFVSKSIQMDILFKEIRKIDSQIYMLTIGYFSGLIFQYIINHEFKSASPRSQMIPFIHVLVILGVLQGFTKHLLTSFPNLNQAVWGVVALLLVKFFVDLLFVFFQNSSRI